MMSALKKLYLLFDQDPESGFPKICRIRIPHKGFVDPKPNVFNYGSVQVVEVLATDDDDRSKGNGPSFVFRMDPNAADIIRASFKVEHDPSRRFFLFLLAPFLISSFFFSISFLFVRLFPYFYLFFLYLQFFLLLKCLLNFQYLFLIIVIFNSSFLT